MGEKGRESQFKVVSAAAVADWLFGPDEMASHSGGGGKQMSFGRRLPWVSCCTSGLLVCGFRTLCPWGREQEARGTWCGCEMRRRRAMAS